MNPHCLCGRVKRVANALVCGHCWDATDRALKAEWNNAWSAEQKRPVARRIKEQAQSRRPKPQPQPVQAELL